jgi:hypothetical protein
MYVKLPKQRQPGLLTNRFGTAGKLEKRKIRRTPDLEIQNSGVFILNRPTLFKSVGDLYERRTCQDRTHPSMTTATDHK